MYYTILTQKEQPEYRPLKKIVKLLLEFAEIDSIYLSKSADASNMGTLTVIISKNNRHYYDEVSDHLWKLSKNHKHFSFCFFNRDCINEEIKEGNLFFILHCQESDLVFSKTRHKPAVNLKRIKLKKLLKKTDERFERRMIECNAIGRDLQHHRRCDNHLMALYVIHQQFRYLFINVSWLVTGEWTPNDSIKGHQEHIKRFNNTLGNVFNASKKEELTIVKQLDRASRTVQRGEEIEPLNAEVVKTALEKLERMKREVSALLQEYREKTKLIFNQHENSQHSKIEELNI